MKRTWKLFACFLLIMSCHNHGNLKSTELIEAHTRSNWWNSRDNSAASRFES
jgi:hypothetical protein